MPPQQSRGAFEHRRSARQRLDRQPHLRPADPAVDQQGVAAGEQQLEDPPGLKSSHYLIDNNNLSSERSHTDNFPGGILAGSHRDANS